MNFCAKTLFWFKIQTRYFLLFFLNTVILKTNWGGLSFCINKHLKKKINSKEVNNKKWIVKLAFFGSNFFFLKWALPWIHKIIHDKKKTGWKVDYFFFHQWEIGKIGNYWVFNIVEAFFKGTFSMFNKIWDECLNEGVSLLMHEEKKRVGKNLVPYLGRSKSRLLKVLKQQNGARQHQ